MKNTKSLQELLVAAATVFKSELHADLSIVYASEDGFIFIEENRARVHVKTIKDLQYHTITRVEALGAESGNDAESGEELDDLKVKYQELYGKAPHHNIGKEKLRTAIAERLKTVTDDGDLKKQNTENDGQTTGN